MMWHPRGYGGQRRDPDQVKREGWKEQGLLAVPADDNEADAIALLLWAIETGGGVA